MKRLTSLGLKITGFILIIAVFMADLSQTALAYNNLINNPSVEAATASVPTDWQTSAWGNLTAKFSYKATGQTGSHSVRADVTNYVDGDAKWYFKPVAVNPLSKYVYSDYYKSSVATTLVVAYTMTDGSTSYMWLADLPASTSWKKTSQYVVIPAGVAQATVYHLIMSNGYVQTDSFVFKQAEDVAVASGVANSSFEIADEVNANAPAGWVNSKWGSNTAAFNYVKTTGYQSTRSAKVTLTNYIDGDAKWMFDPVTVNAGTTYTFSDYYRANVATSAVAMFVDANGNATYQELGSVPVSTAWKRAAFNVVIPATTKRASILHIIAANGYLQTDAFSLVPADVAVISNGVPNNSVEQASDLDPSLPLAWRTAGWGTNTPKYSVLNTGHTGSKSVKVELSKFTDGDAKWMYADQPVVPGSNNKFSAYYQSTTTGHAVVMFTHTDGRVSYFGMHNAEATSAWTLYSDTFLVPATAKTATVFFYINSVGSFTSDDYSIAPYSYVGFDKPRLSLTFDDGWEENVSTVLPLLNQYGFTSTQYYTSQYISDTGDTSGVLAFQNAGHEVGSHTVTHPNLSTITLAQVVSELTQSKQVLETATGRPVVNFASPYGGYNTQVVNEIKKLYRSHRTVDEGYNSKDNFDAYHLKVQNMLVETTPQQVAAWIAQAQKDNTWLILVFHKVDSTNLEAFDTPLSAFEQDLTIIANSGISVVSVNQALDQLTPQL